VLCFVFSDDAQNNPAGGVHFASAAASASQKATLLRLSPHTTVHARRLSAPDTYGFRA